MHRTTIKKLIILVLLAAVLCFIVGMHHRGLHMYEDLNKINDDLSSGVVSTNFCSYVS